VSSVHFSTKNRGEVMKGSRISAVIAGAALSIGGLALAPIDGAAHAQSSGAMCTRVVGVGHHYAVVAYPCPNRGPGYTLLRRKWLSTLHAVQAV
jgi:hypothetical protein